MTKRSDPNPQTGFGFPSEAVCLAFSGSRSEFGSVVVAATTSGLAWSRDNGQRWEIQADTPVFEAVALSPRFHEDSTIHAIERGELVGSRDGGQTWSGLLGGSSVLAIATSVDADHEVIVMAGTETDGVFRSDDAGQHWRSMTPGLLDLTVQSLETSPAFATDKTVFLGTPSGLYRSRNGGSAWKRLDLPADEPGVQVIAISPNFRTDGVVLVGTETDGLHLSRDGGRSWEEPEVFAQRGVTAVACPSGACFAVASDAGVGFSHDGGLTWRISGAHLGPLIALAFGPETRGSSPFFIAGPASGGLVETDDGARWRFAAGGGSGAKKTRSTSGN